MIEWMTWYYALLLMIPFGTLFGILAGLVPITCGVLIYHYTKLHFLGWSLVILAGLLCLAAYPLSYLFLTGEIF